MGRVPQRGWEQDWDRLGPPFWGERGWKTWGKDQAELGAGASWVACSGDAPGALRSQ